MDYLTEIVQINCPYCAERIDVLVDTSVEIQEYVEDCSVCCQPIVMEASVSALGAIVQVRQEND